MKTDQWSCLRTVRRSVLALGGVAFVLGVGAANLEPTPAGTTDRGSIATFVNAQVDPRAPDEPAACCIVGGQCTVGGGPCADDGIGCIPCQDDTDCPDGETCWRICTTSEGQPGGMPCTFSFQCAQDPVFCPTCRCRMGECWAPCSDAADCPTGGDTCDDYGSCSVLSPIACEEAGGNFMPGVTECFQTCDLGACCTDPGVCEDNGGGGMTLEECAGLGGVWHPALRCDDRPCSICPFEDPAQDSRSRAAHRLPTSSFSAPDNQGTSSLAMNSAWSSTTRLSAGSMPVR